MNEINKPQPHHTTDPFTPITPGLPDPQPNTNRIQKEIAPRRFLCVWIPNWPIQRLVVRRPDLRCQRVVLFQRDSRRGQLVSAASPLAMRSGIQIGMPITEAKSLLRRAESPERTDYRPTHRKHPRDQHRHLSQNGMQGGIRQTATANPAESTSDSETNSTGSTAKPSSNSTTAPRPMNTQPTSKNDSFIFEHDPAVDLVALEQLADSLHEFSPIVGLDPVEQPDSIFLDITGLAHLFGDEAQLIRQLSDHFQRQNYLVRVAPASTIGQAWALAKFAKNVRSESPQSQFENTKPENTELENTEPESALAQNLAPTTALPIQALRLSPATTETLHQLGITTIYRLLQIPRPELLSRFGPEIHRRLDQFLGTIDEPIVARYRPPDFSAEQLLEFPTQHFSTIEVIVSRLVNQICQQMRARQQGALEWTVRMNRQKADPIEFRVNLFRPTATVEHVMPLVQMQIESQLRSNTNRRSRIARPKKSPTAKSPTDSAFTEIIVTVTACVLLAQNQRQLFDENPRLDKQTLAQLINRLTSRMGQQNVVYPTLQSGAQPEYSVRFHPLVDLHGTHHRRSKSRPRKSQSHVISRPLRLIKPPIPLETLAVHSRPNPHSNPSIPSSKIARPPALLIYQRDSQTLRKTITHTWGPERIETGWWRGPTTRRDYWRIETETHQQFWIFFDLRKRIWFLHGEF